MTGYSAASPAFAHVAGERLLLRDGSVATVRPAMPGDVERLLRFFRALSPEARRRRFLCAGEPDEAIVRRFCDSSDPSQALTLLALRQDGDALAPIAVASYAAITPTRAEVAFAVADGLHGRGLGTALLERLAAQAAAHGVSAFDAIESPDNTEMLEVFRHCGFEMSSAVSRGEVEVHLDLEASPRALAAMDERNRIATVASLTPILRPRSIAVLGVSRNRANFGRRVFENILRGGFTGAVFAVNPHMTAVEGHRSYASIRDVPGPVDLAVIATPCRDMLSVVDACADAGVRALVIVSAGFAEAGETGRELQRAVLEKARARGLRFVGPNCMGLQNTSPSVRLNASFALDLAPHGRLAIASQSGGIGLALLDLAASRHLGISTFVSLGNKADVSGNDLLQWGESDTDASVLLLYLESFGNPRRFGQLARRIGRQKPIVVVKSGRTSAGTRAAGSHTAGLASSETAVSALFRQSGVIRAESIDEMFDVAECLDLQPLPKGARVAIVTNTGGPGIMAADACEAAGLEVSPLGDATRQALAAGLPANACLNNPVDLIASAGGAEYAHAITALLRSPDVDGLIVVYTPIDARSTDSILAGITDGVVQARTSFTERKPVVLVHVSASAALAPVAAGSERIPTFRFPENAARAVGRVAEYARWKARPVSTMPAFTDIHVREARRLCEDVVAARGDTWLTSEELERLLFAFGLPLLAGEGVRTEDEAAATARLVGYPVVLKLNAASVLHKTDAGGVHLHLADEAAVRRAFRTLVARFPEVTHPGSDAILELQPMVSGVEALIGVVSDPVFGPLVAVGLGGVETELIRDVAFRMVPVGDTDVDDMLGELRTQPVLRGYRGRPVSDVAALEEVVLRVSQMAQFIPELRELDLNPAIVGAAGQGCRIVDARARVARSSGG